MEKTQQKLSFLDNSGLNEKEVQAVVLKEIEPYANAIDPTSAPYLTVEHFLWFIGILVTIASSLLGYIWKKMNANNTNVNGRITESNQRLHERVDSTRTEIESSEIELRNEFTKRCDIIDKRQWYIALNMPSRTELEKK